MTPGRVLGDFLIKEQIGAGGFGTVFRAEQRGLGREAVVKVLRREVQDSGMQRFLREAKLASQLDHPFAAHVYAFGAEPDGVLWIAMEQVRGTGLDALLKAQGPLPLHRFVPFFEKLCEVVQTAHAQGIIHRDLKPSNVMVLSRAGKLLPKLLDLGIAKLHDAGVPDAAASAPVALALAEVSAVPDVTMGATRSSLLPSPQRTLLSDAHTHALDQSVTPSLTVNGGVMGSPHFMAPEQWLNASAADARTDIYALAVLAYQCLTGQLPFDGQTARAIAVAHAKQPFPELPAQFASELSDVLAKGGAKRPIDRYGSAMELATALRAACKLTDEESVIPQVAQDIRELFISDAPQPIAEAMALLEGATRPNRALTAALDVLRVVARYVGALALAARARVGPGGAEDSPEALALIEKLHGSELSAQEWWGLARALVLPFSDARDAHPVPELIGLFVDRKDGGDSVHEALGRMWERLEAARRAVEGPSLTELGRLVADLGSLLQRLFFLHEYRLRLRRGAQAEAWMGLRRNIRPTSPIADGGPSDGEFFIESSAGTPLLTLAPLVQPVAPTPRAPLEPFFLSGTGRHGARLTALPVGFERHDETLWPWFSEHVVRLRSLDGAEGTQSATPYLGLASFTAAEAGNFFGREHEAEAFANRLRVQALLGVVGPSGAGKSSFLQAGVLPLFPTWEAMTVRPGASPFNALIAKLTSERVLPAQKSVGEAREALLARPELLGEWLRKAAEARGHTLMLIADQFEELVTLCSDSHERQQYAQALVLAAQNPDQPVRVVLAFRDDFLIRLQQLPALREQLAAGLQLLGTPSHDDLLRILLKPADRAGYRFEDEALPTEMVKEVESLPGALALLSFTASKLWELRDRQLKRLTRRSYAALGGVGGALAHHAEATLASVPEGKQALVREAFRHLVTAEGTRAVLSRSELDQLLGGSDQAGPLLEKLIVARLLVTSDLGSDDDRVEVIHEALLSSWPRLVQWQREDAENLRTRDALRAAARQWSERGRPRGLLWRKEPLLEYKVWRSRYTGAVTELEAAFAAASLKDENRGKNIRTGLLVGSITVLLVVLAVVARAQRQASASAAEAKSRLAQLWEEQGRLASLDGKPLEALAYLGAAYREGVRDEAIRHLVAWARPLAESNRLSVHAHDGFAVAAVSPDEQTIATGGTDRQVRIWRISDGVRLAELSGHSLGITVVKFSPNGKLLASAGFDGSVRLWNTADWSERATLKSSVDDFVLDIDFSPDGKLLAVAVGGLTALVWDVERGREVARPSSPTRLTQVRFSPDGKLLAASVGPALIGAFDPGTVPVWETSSGKWARQDLAGHGGPVRDLSFSPDSKVLATASEDRLIRLWDLRTKRVSGTLVGHGSIVLSVGFSPDGRRIASTGADGTGRIWDVGERRLHANLLGHTESIPHLRFSSDGHTIVTASDDRTVRLWDAESGAFLWQFAGHTQPIQSLTILRDGNHAVTAGAEGLLKVWNLDRRRYRTFDTGGHGVLAFALTPDGKRVLVARSSGPLLDEREVATGRLLATYKLPARAEALVWSEKTQRVATLASGQVDVWQLPEMTSLLHRGSLQEGATIGTVMSLSAEGDRLAVGHNTQPQVELWDIIGKRKVADLITDGHFVDLVKFSPGPTGLLVATSEGHVASWRPTDGARQWQVKSAGVSNVVSLAASRDGRFVAAGMLDRVTNVWDVKTQQRLALLQGKHAGSMDLAFSHDGTVLAAPGTAAFVTVWETGRFKRIAELPTDGPSMLAAFTPTGELLTSGLEKPLTVRSLGASPLDGDDLERLIKCRTPYRIRGEELAVDLQPDAACPRAW